VHSFSSVYAPPAQRLAYLATVPPTAEAADHTQKKLDDNLCPRDSTFDIERNAFSMVADTVVGTYPISIVHPMVKTYDIYTYQIPRSSVLSSVINTLNDVPAPAYASTKPVSLPSPLSLTPTLAVTPPTPEKPSVLAMRKSTITTPSSPTSVKRNLHGAEAGMHKVRKAKRYRGKENRAPVPIGHRARLNLV
jgi:hypothetical protein